MRKVLVAQHVSSEGLGTIANELRRYGIGADTVRLFRGEALPPSLPPGYSALIVLGGPMGVYDEDRFPFITDELKLIESAIAKDAPLLGVCLGSQMLAKAAGARVYKGKAKEIGWYDLDINTEGEKERLLLGLPGTIRVFQWHGDTFDVPDGAVNLASSELFDNQMIRVGKRAYGLQFHLEVTVDMIRDWIGVNSEELKALKGRIDPQDILKETPARIDDLNRHGRAVISRFLRMVD